MDSLGFPSKNAYSYSVFDRNTSTYRIYHQEMVEITEPMALAMLANQAKNRRLSPIAVKGYVEDFLNNRFIYDGGSLKFSLDGKLLDGQHRLHMVLKINEGRSKEDQISVWFEVKYGFHGDELFDINKVRNNSNQLQIHGVVNAGAVSPVLKLLNSVKTIMTSADSLPSHGPTKLSEEEVKAGINLARKTKYTPHNVVTVEKKNKNVDIYAGHVVDVVRKKRRDGFSTPLVAFVVCVYSTGDSFLTEKLEKFLSIINSGSAVKTSIDGIVSEWEDCPAVTIQNRLNGATSGETQTQLIMKFFALCRAFEDFLSNKSRKTYHLTSTPCVIRQVDYNTIV